MARACEDHPFSRHSVFYLLFPINHMLINVKRQAERHRARVSNRTIIKWVESDPGMQADKLTAANGVCLFPPCFNYRLDLIKSFCDIS